MTEAVKAGLEDLRNLVTKHDIRIKEHDKLLDKIEKKMDELNKKEGDNQIRLVEIQSEIRNNRRWTSQIILFVTPLTTGAILLIGQFIIKYMLGGN